jgi:glycine/D-amino acid oxidase-like deaminating enzyme
VAVVGAGIYGTTAAVRVAESGHDTHLFDPLGVLNAASTINQYRIHAGYHYPRSPETIAEVQEARAEFIEEFRPAIVSGARHLYAIPHEGSRTEPDEYEAVMAHHGLALRSCRPEWMNFEFIARCYEVEEQTYDPDILRSVIEERLVRAGVRVTRSVFTETMRSQFDIVVYATYGLGPSRAHFDIAKYQVAEKILIELPPVLRHVALVVVDGPFTAFDPYGGSHRSLFGSARHTNHFTTTDPEEPIPEHFRDVLNGTEFVPWAHTHFEEMRAEGMLTAPAVAQARYIGSRLTLRVVEDDPTGDRRILHVRDSCRGEIHIFSGKVVSAVKAARLVCERIASYR